MFNQTFNAFLQMVQVGSASSDSYHFYVGVYSRGRNRSQMIAPNCVILNSNRWALGVVHLQAYQIETFSYLA